MSGLPLQTHNLPRWERERIGRWFRDQCPRKRHAEWTAPASRRDPVEVLIEQGRTRLQELLPLRYYRMKLTPFDFMRGAAAVMAADLDGTAESGISVQVSGDCHCLNFGGFATPERRQVFDLNDFDETSVAPWEWDVKRLATSFVVAALDRRNERAGRIELARTVARAYRGTMAELSTRPVLEAWYRGQKFDEAQARSFGSAEKDIGIARRARKHPAALINIEHTAGASPRIEDKAPDLYHLAPAKHEKFEAAVRGMLPGYIDSLTPERRVLLGRYRFADVAFKVAGVGSVGTFCGVLLMMSGDNEALYLQFKEATRSVLEAHAGPSPYALHGERVVRGQRLLQAASDILLGFGIGPQGRHFHVRQLRDATVKPRLESMTDETTLGRYAETCGAVLARAHARSADAVVLSAYLGGSDSFDEAVGRFAWAYAKQTEADHDALCRAINSQRIPDSERDS